MPWGTIRKATDEDIDRLDAAARRFIARHRLDPIGHLGLHFIGVMLDDDDPVNVIESALSLGLGADDLTRSDLTYLRHLWKGAVRRALQSRAADGIAYGHVGYESP